MSSSSSAAPRTERRFSLLASVRPRWLDLAALLAGASLPLAFAPVSLWFWAPVPLAILFAVVFGLGWRRALWRGGLFGAGQFGSGIFWIVESFQYNFVPFSFAVLATGGLVTVLALYPAISAVVAARIGTRATLWALVGAPAAWVLGEWLRGTLFTGFAWLQLGQSQIDGPLAGVLPLGGTYAVSFLVALIGAGLAVAVTRPTRRHRLLAMAVAGTVLGIGLLTLERTWTVPAGPALAVAVIQGNVAQEEKWLPELRQPTLRRYLELSRQHWGADLVVWPETAVPGMLSAMGPYLRAVEQEAAARGTELLVGIPSLDATTARPLNAVVKLGGADHGALYVKRHLVPFGEYLPWPGLFAPVLDAIGLRLSNFLAGPRSQSPLTVGGRPIGVSICYEVAFARDILRALPVAELLVNVSNDAWFGDTIGPHQHLQLARVRARETGRWLVRATNTGISAVIDPRGAVRARAAQFKATTLRADVVPQRGQTPYGALGDTPVVLVMFALVLVALIGGWVGRAEERKG